ncbi:MAG: tripartite tricarboxylate transporter TctB family protein [Lachnospiraceae bacterium]|nr:tripartite tricarboxylate transporter TctB family protein [Lachnospiraceae bacterium]
MKMQRERDIVFIGVLIIISLFCLFQSLLLVREYPAIDSAAVFPLLTSVCMLFFSGMAMINTIRKKPEKAEGEDEEEPSKNRLWEAIQAEIPLNALVLGAAVAVYVFLLNYVGFYISSAIFLIGTIGYLSKWKKMGRTVLFTVISLAIIYVVIERIFNVLLP